MFTEKKMLLFWLHCSDDEGEPDDDDEDEEDDDNHEEEEEEDEDEDDASDDCNEDGEIVKENGITRKEDSPAKPQSPVRWHKMSFYIYVFTRQPHTD